MQEQSALVIADTSIWIDYLSGRNARVGDAVARLIDDAKMALVGIVLMELLRGTRGEGEQRRLEDQLHGVVFIEMTIGAWRRAGVMSAELDTQGTPTPRSDVIIAALALEHGLELYTRDKHFERIPGLRLYQAEGDTP
jgi:hypothetical protein